VKVDIIDYVNAMLEDFSVDFKPTDSAPSPAAEDSFAVANSKKLDTERVNEFHTFAKGLFACK
jgi:hypothetical protein